MMQKRIKKLLTVVLVIVLSVTLSSGVSGVEAKIPKVKKITMNKKKVELVVGQKLKLKVKKVYPRRASKSVSWKSSNKKVAIVSQKGVVTSIGTGVTKITATSKKNKKVKAVCIISVKEKVATTKSEDDSSTTTEITNGEKGDKGDQGVQGEKGDKGDKGDQGVGVSTAYINEKGELIIELTNGTSINAGQIGTTVHPEVKKYSVTFRDYDGRIIKTEEVEEGKAATAPANPTRADGYIFDGWDKAFDNITENIEVIAQYKQTTGLSMSTTQIEVEPGSNSVRVVLSINDNPGILGMTLAVKYNQKYLTLKNAENGEAVKDVLTMTKGAVLQSGCKFAWDGQDITDEQIKDGEVLVLTFDVAENTPSGNYDIEFLYDDGDIVDKELEPVNIPINKGCIFVK